MGYILKQLSLLVFHLVLYHLDLKTSSISTFSIFKFSKHFLEFIKTILDLEFCLTLFVKTFIDLMICSVLDTIYVLRCTNKRGRDVFSFTLFYHFEFAFALVFLLYRYSCYPGNK